MARILLVDDDLLIIKLYQLILKSSEFDLEITGSGEAMLAAIQKEKPDVILLDVVLPDHSGLDLCNRIKKDPEYVGTKIILVSGQDISPAQIAAGIELGADDYLVKPFHPKELLARVKNCLKLKNIEEELRDRNNELKELSSYLQNIREQERKLVAYEVQEQLGQVTAALKMDIDWLAMNIPNLADSHKQKMMHASDMTKLIIEHSRRIASSLRPSMIDELGLYASLEWQCKNFALRNSIPCRFSQEVKEEDIHLSTEINTVIFRICQEALMNIFQHAEATQVSVHIKSVDNNIVLDITDNGKGFDSGQQKKPFGLIGMRERAHSFNGQLHIKTEIGKGTTVSLVIPQIK